MFNTAEFFAAFGQHGLLVDVVYEPPDGSAPVLFKAGFKRPSELLLSDAQASDEYQLELHVPTAPALEEGSEISIGGETYTLRRNPQRQGDGAFATVGLTLVQP